MIARVQPEEGSDSKRVSAQRRFCVLGSDSLRCFKDEHEAKRAASAAKAARAEAAAKVSMEASVEVSEAAGDEVGCRIWPTPSKQAQLDGSTASSTEDGEAQAKSAAAAAAATATATASAPSSIASATIDLRLVTRIRPCSDASAAPHAFELRTLGPTGHEGTSVFEPIGGGFEATDAWLRALARSVPSAAFEVPREGSLGWNHFPDPLAAHVSARTHHPLAVLSPADELACALLTLAEWRGLPSCDDAAAALRAATTAMVSADGHDNGGAPRVDGQRHGARDACGADVEAILTGGGYARVELCQSRPHVWSELELSLLLCALMHSARICSLRLVGFRLADRGERNSLVSRALGALLHRNGSLRRIELRGCFVDEAAIAQWTAALEANPNLPLSALSLTGCGGLPRASHAAGLCLSRALSSLRAPLTSLDLDGCGLTGAPLRLVLDALHRHDRRFFTLCHLRRLTLSSDSLEDWRTREALTALIRRSTNLTTLRMLRSDRYGGRGAAFGAAADAVNSPLLEAGGGGTGEGGGGGGGGAWFAPPSCLVEVLEALLANSPPSSVSRSMGAQ